MSYKPFETIQDLLDSKDHTWTRASNYSGPDFEAFVMTGISRSRDSDTLTESNFHVLLDTLGGESKTVEVHRFGHWGCGWFETIVVSRKAKKKLEILKDCLNALADYPVLDDSDYSEREQEAMDSDFDCYYSDFQRNAMEMIKRSDPDLIGSEADWTEFLREVYAEDCSYRGQEDAYIHYESIRRFLSNDYSGLCGLIECGNQVAIKFARVFPKTKRA